MASNETRKLTGGRALAEMLKVHDAGPMFGMGGFQLLPFYDAVRELGMAHSLINDERCGAFAADAWARVAGRPGVCDATLGPGATNLATALVESLNAGVPLIVITGDTHRQHSWKNMTQEARQLDILRPCVKEVIRVEIGSRIPELVRRAYQVATSGRPGPVLIDVPEDICHGVFDFAAGDMVADATTKGYPARRARPAAEDIEGAARLLRSSNRPIVLAGGGVHLSGAHQALVAFAETLGIPVAHTLSGKGAISCKHALNAGLFGRYSRIANDLIDKADLVIAVGCKLGEIATKRYTLPPAGTPIIQLDIVAEEIGRCARADVGLWGDAREGLRDLLAAAKGGPDRAAWAGEAARRMAAWRAETAPRLASNERPIAMTRLVAEIEAALPEDGILVADGGFAAHWAGLLFDTKRPGRGFVPDRGFASIGYGLPGAIGCRLASPGRAVIALTGDGGFNMTLGELETARRMGLGIVLAIVNNAASGYVKALQQALFGGRFQSSDLSEVDYAAVARAMGCNGMRVEDPNRLGAALREAITVTDRPTVVDVVVTRDPTKMLPGVDNRAVKAKAGDRIA
ncbi:MAG: thiamine pyrophosphate-binding protein [Alphaproteobacteria bacterium]|nr:thiamine pyrophosphate-binding protein [Alphaproteobacteria bacterium]